MIVSQIQPLARALSLVVIIGTMTLLRPTAGASQQVFPLDPAVATPVLEAVARSSPRLAARRSALAAAQSRLAAAGFALPAVLSAEMEDVPGGTELGNAGFRLEVGKELLTGGRGPAQRALASTEVRLAEAALYAAELETRSATVSALALASGWSAISARLAAEDSLLLGAEGSLRARFATADARYTDVLRLRTERVRVQTDRAEAIAEARTAIGALEGLLGAAWADAAPLVEGAAASAASREPPPLPPTPDTDSLVEASAPVRLALAGVERAQAARALVDAEQRTRFAAAVGAQRVGGGDGGFTVGPTLAFSMTLPFTASRANRAATLAADQSVEATRAELASARAEVRAHLTRSRTRYEAARERLAVFDAALLQGVRQEREAAVAAYRTGSLSLVELLDFERALARAEIERHRAHMEAVMALADLLSGTAPDSREPISSME